MSDPTATPARPVVASGAAATPSTMNAVTAPVARPVSLFTIVFLFAIFAAFLLVIRWFYQPAATPAFVGTPENLSKDLEWRASRDARRKTLQDVRDAEAKKLSGYSWVDQKAGVVELPIDRAMELTARDLAAKQAKK